MPEIVLTAAQQAAFDGMMAFANGCLGVSLACLQGYAGTGKTTLVAKLVNELDRWMRIAVMAPTNKAVGVLQDKIGSLNGVEFGSLHSFVGLRLLEGDDGQHVCAPEGQATLHDYSLAIVDECSMVSTRLFQTVLRSKRNCRVLFVGDPAQLPPVDDGNDSPTFRHVATTWHLSEVVRQARDNPIIAASVAVRRAIEAGERFGVGALMKAFPPPPAVAGIIDGGIDTIVDVLVSESQAGRDCRALAWRNDTVDRINARVHAEMYPGVDTPFAPGETVIANTEFRSVRERDFQSVRVFNSEELTVGAIASAAHPGYPDIPAWRMELQRDTGATVVAYLPVDVCAMRRIENALWDDFRIAKANGMKNKAAHIKGVAWGLKNAFANVKHAYAMTAHKSQGSTFDTALIHWGDLHANRNDYDFNRLLYVAMTRASKHLAIVMP